MDQKFGIVSVHPGTLLDTDELEKIIGPYLRSLEELGGYSCDSNSLPDNGIPPFLLVATGGSEQVVLRWWAEHHGATPDESLFLIAHPGNNSLPAALEVLARLQQDGTPGRIFYLEGPEDGSGLQMITEAAHEERVRRALRRARIGLVGEPSDWLVASMPDASTVRRTWGPTVVPVEMDGVVKTMAAICDEELEEHADELIAGASGVFEPSTSDIRDVARVYLALQQIVVDHDLDALTVRCFDFVQNQKTTGCFGLAQLTDEGVIAGCEGDLVSTIGLLWARLLVDETPWMANPAQLDPERNTLWLAHCTVPRSLVSSYGLRSHFESGLGVGIQGTLPPGQVTLLRIGGKEMDRVWLAEGEILRSGNAENLCRTQAEIQLTRGGKAADLLRAPLGNHLVLVPGHHLDCFGHWCESAATDFGMVGEYEKF